MRATRVAQNHRLRHPEPAPGDFASLIRSGTGERPNPLEPHALRKTVDHTAPSLGNGERARHNPLSSFTARAFPPLSLLASQSALASVVLRDALLEANPPDSDFGDYILLRLAELPFAFCRSGEDTSRYEESHNPGRGG